MPRAFRDKSLQYRILRKKLRKFGVIELKRRGKGSHRMFYQADTNNYYPIKCHGEGAELNKEIVRAARERFNIKIEEFY